MDDAFGHWFAGLTDGEGCFTCPLKPSRKTPCAEFKISLRRDDHAILEHIQQTLGIGRIYINYEQSTARAAMASFTVFRKEDIVKLQGVFERYPLRSKKRRDFEIWSEFVDLWTMVSWRGRSKKREKEHAADRERLLELRDRLRQSRKL